MPEYLRYRRGQMPWWTQSTVKAVIYNRKRQATLLNILRNWFFNLLIVWILKLEDIYSLAKRPTFIFFLLDVLQYFETIAKKMLIYCSCLMDPIINNVCKTTSLHRCARKDNVFHLKKAWCVWFSCAHVIIKRLTPSQIAVVTWLPT